MENKINYKNLIRMKMSKEKILILILSLIILGGVGVLIFNQVTDKAYQRGIQDANLFIQQEMINSLNQNGYIPFSFIQDGQTYQLKLAVMETNKG